MHVNMTKTEYINWHIERTGEKPRQSLLDKHTFNPEPKIEIEYFVPAAVKYKFGGESEG